MTDSSYSAEPTGLEVAVVGMAGRFPGAPSVSTFWENLAAGRESISFFGDEELKAAGVDPGLLAHPDYVKARGALEDATGFDAAFFGFNRREAEITDPQQRLFLECAWEAIESAGYDAYTYPGAIGVYAGVSLSDYASTVWSHPELRESAGWYQVMLGTDKDYLATRVSYKLNLRGPSVVVQTACSTSLVAVHMACRSLLGGECSMALAGGVSAAAEQRGGYLYQKGGIRSPDGHCRAFDARAEGTIEGSGVGVVLLKRLQDALEDGDPIHAVILGSAINNDGSLKVGYTAPSVEGQAAVVRDALSMAEVPPDSVGYVETHGTGTPLGDPIEIAALTQAFRSGTDRRGFCAIGSVKSNVGHLDAAAGVTGLIKTVLALRHRVLPPSLHVERPNPSLGLEDSPFHVLTERRSWDKGPGPRRAGVSSFGVGGTNAHVVLEEPPALGPSGPARPWQILVLSARTETALQAARANLARHLRDDPALPLADAAYTLQVGRSPFPHRAAVVCRDAAGAAEALEASGAGAPAGVAREERPVAFLFPGQGAQHVGMARGLYESEPVFRAELDRCAELLRPHLGLDLRALLYPAAGGEAAAEAALGRTETTQPALFAVEYALARVWMEWGVRPEAMLGHSIGEYVAACLAGVFTLEDALALVAARGRLMQGLPAGAMLAVPLPEAELAPLLEDGVGIAAVNAPGSCVVSGPEAAVEEVRARLEAREVASRRLRTSHAFHSEMMEPILEAFRARVAEVPLRAPELPYVSNVTGKWIRAEEATDPSYWARHLRESVRFGEGLATLLDGRDPILLEVGPGQNLTRLMPAQGEDVRRRPAVASLRHPTSDDADDRALLEALGRVWAAGGTVDWSRLHAGARRRRVPLPTYPFERQRYCVEPARPAAGGRARRARRGKVADVGEWFWLPSWKRSLPPVGVEDAIGGSPWLVFADAAGVGDALAARLRAAGEAVAVVRPGERFERLGDDLYTMRPGARGDLDALLAARGGEVPRRFVHLWNLEAGPDGGAAGFEDAQARGFHTLLVLARALAAVRVSDPVRVWAVTGGVHEVTGAEPLVPAHATLLGPLKVLPQEYPHVRCRSLDVEPPASAAAAEALAERLLGEVRSGAPEAVVAYRGGHRWVQTFEPLPLATAPDAPPRLRPRGVYLITGGLGQLGLVLGEYLAGAVGARLVLAGRSELPPRDGWDAWLEAHPADDPTSIRIRGVRAIEAAGGEVVAVVADAADPAAMRGAVEEALRRWGALDGVVHAAAAGAAEGDPFAGIAETGEREAEWHFRPKVGGAYALAQALEGLSPDFVLLFSSLSAVLGGLRFSAYAAANLFLDAFAHQRSREGGIRWMSVDWDGWRPDPVGAAASSVLGMNPAEGVDAFRRILSMPLTPQVVVSTGDLEPRLEAWIQRPPETGPRDDEAPPPAGSGRMVDTPYVAPENEIEEVVAGVWRQMLGIEQVGIHDDFLQLGGHSLLGIQILSRLRREFQTDLSVDAIFRAPTVAGLSAMIEEVLIAEMEDLTEEEALSLI